MKRSHEQTSKFLSYVLRHQPQDIGLTLDSEGWAEVDRLIACAARHGKELTAALIADVVRDNDKKRFALSADGARIRAVQGHSAPQVNIRYEERTPPTYLWHGTATRFLASIRAQGLIAGTRQYVHLSADEHTAQTVGARHGKPVTLKIRAGEMQKQGMAFYQADNGVWLTHSVPAEFIVESNKCG